MLELDFDLGVDYEEGELKKVKLENGKCRLVVVWNGSLNEDWWSV